MDSATLSFDILIRRASGRSSLAPLLRALGLEPVPAAPVAGAYGLGSGDGVRDAAIVAGRGGLAVLLVELASGESAETMARISRRVRQHAPARPHLFLFAGPRYRRLTFATFGLEGELRRLEVDRLRPRRTDIEALEEMAAREGEGGVALALRHARALDRTRITRQFFRDFKARRGAVAAAWTGVPPDRAQERAQLALLLLSRLLFLYFLQKHGHLAGDPAFLPGLLQRWRRRPGTGSFFRDVLHPLFFGSLNTRPEHRSAKARALGPLPYLNGGLFERHALERRFPDADLPDSVLEDVFDNLLERYRFTTREAADAAVEGADDVGIDPEMLGRVFEGLMAADQRGSSGTFYTPAPVVDRLVRESLVTYLSDNAGLPRDTATRLVRDGDAAPATPDERDRAARALASVRVLDPACGSGAFLLGALSRLVRLRAALGEPADVLRRDVVARALHGVDVQDDAALLCSLRLWLALSLPADAPDAEIPPLPNLDRRIRQGDALLDPLDLSVGGGEGGWGDATSDPAVRRAIRAIPPVAERYLTAGPEDKPALVRALAGAERALAEAWIGAMDRRLERWIAELGAEAEARDLFGEAPPSARRAARTIPVARARRDELARLHRKLEESGSLPFFSFGVHFAEAAERGFDLILSNPPWVRAHRWPATVRRLVRSRYEVCRRPGWRRGAELARAPGAVGAQVDLALLFLERSIRLLAPGGTLALLLPAKVLRSLYGAGGRRLLLRETTLAALEDHSLDQRSIFRADAFAAAVVASRRTARNDTATAAVQVTMVRRNVPPLRFAIEQDELPILPDDPDSPWLLAPPAARIALRRMQAAGPPLGTRHHVRRGVVTGANDVLLIRSAEPKLGGLAWIHAEGYHRADGEPYDRDRFRALVESSMLRPLVRGADLAAWRYSARGHILFLHDDETAAPRPAPPRTARYLARHETELRARSGSGEATAPGTLFRLAPDSLGAKVAWKDIAATLEAVAVPARVRGLDGEPVPVVPLNTVYFVSTASDEEAMRLAALLNSLPVRTFARAIAERAKDARFRFLAWTVALIPIPEGWDRSAEAIEMAAIARTAHHRGTITPEEAAALDRLAARCYGLDSDDLDALSDFDRWLRGTP